MCPLTSGTQCWHIQISTNCQNEISFAKHFGLNMITTTSTGENLSFSHLHNWNCCWPKLYHCYRNLIQYNPSTFGDVLHFALLFAMSCFPWNFVTLTLSRKIPLVCYNLHRMTEHAVRPGICVYTWWRHQIGSFFRVTGICVGNSPVNSPHKVPIMRTGDFRLHGVYVMSP